MASFNNQKRPVKPSGESHFIYFCRAVWDALFNGEFPFGNTDTVTFEYSAGKYYFKAKPARPPTPSGSFRGEYDQTATYLPQDIVVIRSGSNAGTFVCIKASTGSDPQLPDVGNQYWICISNSAAQWM